MATSFNPLIISTLKKQARAITGVFSMLIYVSVLSINSYGQPPAPTGPGGRTRPMPRFGPKPTEEKPSRMATPRRTTTPAAPATTPSAAPEKVIDERFASLRDPFWPIGFTPHAEEVVEEVVEDVVEEEDTTNLEFDEAVKQLSVRGIMKLGTEYTAMINNQVVRKGDLVSLVIGSTRYRWRVRSIAKRGVRFEPYDKMPAGANRSTKVQRATIERVVK